MLGVATLIVVNSVMGGFSSKLRERPPAPPPIEVFVPEGAIVGHALAHSRREDPPGSGKKVEMRLLEPGDDIIITTVSGAKLSPVYARFAVSDYFKSEMSEYDSRYV